MGAIQIANITGVQWSGDTFNATVAIPALGTYPFDGTIAESGKVNGKLVVEGVFTLKLEGKSLD